MRVCRETALEVNDNPRVTFMFHILQQLNTAEVGKVGENISTVNLLILFIGIIFFYVFALLCKQVPACYFCTCV